MSLTACNSLFQPCVIPSNPPIVLRNRIIMSPLTRSRSAPTNVPTDLNVEYYKQRARGGAGLIISEGALISRQGTQWPNAPGIWSDEHATAWRKITEAVHAEGAHIFAQLWHVGRIAHPEADEQKASGEPVHGPSAIPARGIVFEAFPQYPSKVTPTALEDPQVIIDQYRRGAVYAKLAGFDGVELHAATGYLVDQFLDSSSNTRTDKWGGSIENRCRFGLEVLRALVGVFGKGRVGVKLSPTGGYNDVGMPLQEAIQTFKYFIEEAEKLDLAYFLFTRYFERMDLIVDGKLRGTKHDIISTYKPFIKRTPVFLNGNLSPEEAAELVGAGKIDGAVFGCLWISHPDLVKRIEHGKPLDNAIDFKRLYGIPGADEVEQRKGYTDYPETTYN